MKKEIYTGTVIWFHKNYGFIAWSKDGVVQSDLFCHFSDIDVEGFKTLAKGQKVSFELGVNHNNQPKAVAVKVLV